MNQLCQRSTELMDAGGFAIPDLQRAAAPVIENVRMACTALQVRANAGQPTYAILANLRAYLALADAVPKPFPFPEAARAQFTELRDEANRVEAHFRDLLESKDQELRGSDRDNLERYAEANRRVPPPAAGKHRVVFLGDSITDLWRLNEYFPGRDFINRGISGQISGEMLGRFKADVMDLHPESVVILAGTNDLARNIPLGDTENNYVMMATLARASNIRVIFSSVLPVSDYHADRNPQNERTKDRQPANIKALNDWLRNYCSLHGDTYLDYYSALADKNGQIGADLADDGLHPNAKGYRIMAPLVLAAIDKGAAKGANDQGTAPPQPVAPVKPTGRRGASQ
jgi:lysophospholipase L1-like esterase